MDLHFFNHKAKKQDQIVPIELGGRTSKAVHLQLKGDQFTLLNYPHLDAPIYEKTFSADRLSHRLRRLMRVFRRPRTKQITLALGVADTLFRQVELPFMPVDDLRLMLRYHTKNYLQQDLADHSFDCCYLSSSSGSKENEA